MFFRRLVLPIGFLAAACGPADETGGSSLVVAIDSSGPVPVRTVSGDPERWTAELIGAARPEAGIGFSQIRSIALDPRGGVWVADVGEKRLSRWSDSGEWIEDRGRIGAGPGEFASPYNIAVHDGGLFVQDVDQSRVLRFDLAGGSDSSWHSGFRITGGALDVRFFPGPDGPIAMVYTTPTEAGARPQLRYLPVTGTGVSIARPEFEQLDNVQVCRLQGGIMFFGSPFSPGAKWTPMLAGSVAAVEGEYRLEQYTPEGVKYGEIRRPMPRDPVTDAEYAEGTASWEKFRQEHSDAGCEGRIVRYTHKPTVNGLFPAEDGALWVEFLRNDSLFYEIWNGTELTGVLPAPDRDGDLPPAILGDRIAVVVEVPEGGQEVRIYRVRPQD